MKIAVGIQGAGYVEARTFFMAHPPDVTYLRSYDTLDILSFVQRRLHRAPSATSFLNCLHCDLGVNRVDLLHFVNTISCSNTPWISTFEHYMPRWNPRSSFGMGLLTRSACRKLIAMSGYARDAQLSLLEKGSATGDAIAERLCVLHPPQQPLVSSYDEKVIPGDMFSCTFVGRDFFRKGGKEIIAAFAQLRSEGEEIQLRVISSLGWGDYVTGSTDADARAALTFLSQGSPYVIHERELPNEEVLATLRGSHLSLLPTYDDTYGFSVLESQASGTPVITTNVCALTEINSDAAGWVIRLPLDEHGQALLATEDDRKRASALITEGIYVALKAALHDPAATRVRGRNALERIRAEHAPGGYAAALHDIYTEALHPRT